MVINGGATVVIENDIPANNSATLSGIVFEDGLTGLSTGIGGGATSVQFTNAQLSGLVNVGADEPLTVKLNAAIDNVNTGLDSKGADIFFDYVDATHVNGVADGRTVFTIVESPAGTFTFTLLDQIDHTPLNIGGGDNETISLGLANVFTATDFDGDQIVIDAGASITINNDVPVANFLTKSIVANAGVDTNLMVIMDISGSMDEPSGMEGLDKLQAAIASVKELIEQYDALGQVKVRIVTFSTNADDAGDVWMTVDQARAFLNNLLDNDGLTNYDAALDAAIAAYPRGSTERPPERSSAGRTCSYFLSDGNPNQPEGDAGINGAEETTWINFLKANDINSFALGFGEPGDVNQSAIDPIAYNGKAETNSNGQVITDLNLLTATLVSTITPPVNGNVKTDGGNGIGADEPGFVSQVTFGGNIVRVQRHEQHHADDRFPGVRRQRWGHDPHLLDAERNAADQHEHGRLHLCPAGRRGRQRSVRLHLDRLRRRQRQQHPADHCLGDRHRPNRPGRHHHRRQRRQFWQREHCRAGRGVVVERQRCEW